MGEAMFSNQVVADQPRVQILYAKDLVEAREVVDIWLDKTGNTVEVRDIQIQPGDPTVVLIVYRKQASS